MLDMGFINDVRRLVAMLRGKRQTLLFSATMPTDIRTLADNILTNPVYVAVTPVASTVEVIDQSIYFVEKADKPLLLQHLLRDRSMERVLIFTRTKHGANKVAQQLARVSIDAGVIHGGRSQSARQQALNAFKAGTSRILVATDIAARGIDVDNITHVINYDLPNEPESYVHRIGRTGRAGASGIALSFCDVEERAYLIDIERLTQQHIRVAQNYPYQSGLGLPPATNLAPNQRPQRPPSASRPPSSAPRSHSAPRPSSGPQRPRGATPTDQRREKPRPVRKPSRVADY
jgi:ATP-dependent RNA helicase RhlE